MKLAFTKFAQAAIAAVLFGAAATTVAQPAIIYDMGGKFDKSFNEAA